MELKSYQKYNGINEDMSVNMAQPPQPQRHMFNDNIISNNNNNNNIINNNKTKLTFGGNECAVKLSDVSIGFYRKVIFERLNITVPKTKIYSILGPKKCGKSLILQCIAGLIKPNKGDIQVLETSPGFTPAIGYMPQELPLFDGLTVEETMKYFGQLYQLADDVVRSKIDYLVDSLSTKQKNSLIRHLTNSDKVIVSLAVTVLHSPKILLLDQPTVYCDPLLKKSIWSQLRSLCTLKDVTIIVTTNHIEEAKFADMVAFVRDGTLREQELPKQLTKELAIDSVEDIFINLFTNHSENNDNSSVLRQSGDDYNDHNHRIAMNNQSFNEIDLSSKPSKCEILSKINTSSADRISALYYKNLKQQIRKGPLLLFQLLFPALAVALFCACIGKNPYDIRVGVYNPDRPSFVSDIILKSFNTKIIQLHYYDTFDTAFQAVRQHDVWAMLSFPHNYTRSMLQRSSQPCEVPEETELDVEDETVEESVIHSKSLYNNETGVNVDTKSTTNATDLEVEDMGDTDEDLVNESADSVTSKSVTTDEAYDTDDYETVEEPRAKLFTTIDLYMDNTNLLISGAIKTQVILALKKAKNRSTDMSAGYAPPLQIIDPNVYGPNEAEMSEFITPGIIIAIVFLTSLLFPGLTLINERKSRQLERSAVAGVRPYEVIISHLMIYILILCVQISLILFFTFVVFDLPILGSVYLVFGLVFAQGVNGLFYSVAVAAVCRNEMQAIAVWLATFSTVIVLGGTFWPIECMPRLAIILGRVLPQSIAGNGLRSVLSRGWDVSHTTIQLSFIVPIVWIAVLFIISIVAFRIRK